MIPAISRDQIYGWRSPGGRLTQTNEEQYLLGVMDRASRRGYVFALIPAWACRLTGRYYQAGARSHWVVCAVRPQTPGYYDAFASQLGRRRYAGAQHQDVCNFDYWWREDGIRQSHRTMRFGHTLFAWTWFVDRARRETLGWDPQYAHRLRSYPSHPELWSWQTTRDLGRLVSDYQHHIRDIRTRLRQGQRDIERLTPELARFRAERRRRGAQQATVTPEVRAAILALPDVQMVGIVPQGFEVTYYPTICRRVQRGRTAADCNFDVFVPALTLQWQAGMPLPIDVTDPNGRTCHPHRGCFGDYTRGMERAFQAGDLLGSVLAVAQWRKTHGAGSYTLPPLDCVRQWFRDERGSSPSVFQLEDNGTLRTVDISWLLPKPLWFPTLAFGGVHVTAIRPNRITFEGLDLTRERDGLSITRRQWTLLVQLAVSPWAGVMGGNRTLAADMHDNAVAAASRAARNVNPVTGTEHTRLHQGRYFHTHGQISSSAMADRDMGFHYDWWLSTGRALSIEDWAAMRAEVGGYPRPSQEPSPEPPEPPPSGRTPVSSSLRWPFAIEEAEHNVLHLSSVPHLHGRVLGHDRHQAADHTDGVWGGPTAEDWSVPPLPPEDSETDDGEERVYNEDDERVRERRPF